ncbi:hypothetical protein MMC11_006143 [Xylographa trunciseda]|nr:hypothetical protein [Xylographa trunciseda]
MDDPVNSGSQRVWEHETLLEATPARSKEAEVVTHGKPRPRSCLLKSHLWNFVLGFLLGLSFALLSTLYIISTTPATHQPLPLSVFGIDPSSGKPLSWFNGPCGNSSASARLHSCHFDMLSFAWQPPNCFTPDDLVDETEFMALGPWPWYLENGTEISEEEVRKGESRYLFTSFEWHVAHCTLLWRKLHRKVLNGEPVDGYVADLKHTEHCGKVLRMERKTDKIWETRVWTKFPKCG